MTPLECESEYICVIVLGVTHTREADPAHTTSILVEGPPQEEAEFRFGGGEKFFNVLVYFPLSCPYANRTILYELLVCKGN